MKELKLPRAATLPFKDFDTNPDKLVLEKFHMDLVLKGYCYIKVIGGDYDGSIAKFTISSICKESKFEYRGCRSGVNIKTYWSGRLSWEGKRNNPKFSITHLSCIILEPDEGEVIETNLVRFDLKTEGSKLLEQDIKDVDSNTLCEGDDVVYMNLRYGYGGQLCRGTVKAFKAHARDGYVSVIIENVDGSGEQSQCRYPHMQIMKQYKINP